MVEDGMGMDRSGVRLLPLRLLPLDGSGSCCGGSCWSGDGGSSGRGWCSSCSVLVTSVFIGLRYSETKN